MELGPALVIAIRLLVPVSILRYPLGGALAAVAADALDVVLLTFIDRGDLSDYHSRTNISTCIT